MGSGRSSSGAGLHSTRPSGSLRPMTTDLTILALTALFATVLPLVYIVGLTTVPDGYAWGLGNRDRPFGGERPWAQRARRAHANLVENLLPFAALVLIAHVSGRANATTALGAEMFFSARLAYTAVYIAGLTPWRTLMFAIGQTGMLLILLQLLG